MGYVLNAKEFEGTYGTHTYKFTMIYERLIERRKVIRDKFVESRIEVDGKPVPIDHLRTDVDPVTAVEMYIEWLDTQ